MFVDLHYIINHKEYDMVVVCASALLGFHPLKGFCDPDAYLPILSSTIKVTIPATIAGMIVREAAKSVKIRRHGELSVEGRNHAPRGVNVAGVCQTPRS